MLARVVRRKTAIAAVLFLAALAAFNAAFVPIAIAAVACTCPGGGTLSGTTCALPAPTSPATQTTTPSCPAGYTLSGGATCTAMVLSGPCPAGYTLVFLSPIFYCRGPAT